MISIIIPIYNVEDFIGPCIESVLKSKYTDFELILVDDGSSDGSGRICNHYAEIDPRVRPVHKANAGVAEARNTGLKEARGEYIMFVDSDDLIHPEMSQVLMDALQSGDYDFSMIYGIKLPEETHRQYIAEHSGHVEPQGMKVIRQEDYIKRIFDISAYQYDVVWNKLYKKSFIDNLFFKTTGGEDLEWNNRMGLRINQAILVEEYLYFYIQRETSMMHQGMTRTFVDRSNSYRLCLTEIPKDNRQYRAWCIKAMYAMAFFIRYKCRGTEMYKVAKANCKSIYNETRSELMSSDLDWSKKMRILCNYHFPFVYNAVMDRLIKRQQNS